MPRLYLVRYLVRIGQVVVIFNIRQCDEATKVITVLVAVAVVLADALVKLGPLSRTARVPKLVEAQRGLNQNNKQ